MNNKSLPIAEKEKILREIQHHAEEIERLTKILSGGGQRNFSGRLKKNGLDQASLRQLALAARKERL